MWLFTNIGFFSAVLEGSDEPRIVVRVRVREDLSRLIGLYLKSRSVEIVELENRDYPYRIFLSQAEWARIVSELAEDIDYGNFKDSVAKQDGHTRAHIYGRVWQSMLGMESELGIRPRNTSVYETKAKPPSARRQTPTLPLKIEEELVGGKKKGGAKR